MSVLGRLGRKLGIAVAAGALVVGAGGTAAGSTGSRLAGTWVGEMHPTAGGLVHPYAYRVTIASDGRSGTWQTGRCRGRLAYVGPRQGYAIFHEHLTSGGCTGKGTDQIKRVGGGLFDSFVSVSGSEFDSTGTLRRT